MRSGASGVRHDPHLHRRLPRTRRGGAVEENTMTDYDRMVNARLMAQDAEIARLRAALAEVLAADHAEGDVYETLCEVIEVARKALEDRS